ncbi:MULTISPECIES: XrtA/PEP-CTERM system exopolysaccharide export protein [Sphingomonas]|mgnify:FL=1|uniref:Polysaccharide export outer membrane protein n=3 Tax=Pseudomonadota TaxID=1224 RepID=A0A7X5ZUP3_9SPHN|nr:MULTISPECIES: XrtA/PEP-CTERM system exopolysaccharide export protein [Sphingomonas]MDF2383307.1 polysaccharide export protein [Nostoc ellipsosporum NOK]MBN8811572.1 polysaccharide export protein [Sphingomonas sp.]NIJ63899.1 polysaccharide export outer membrane protein [Sphingomonas leidyi]OJY49817.1 MAG: polysaccharide export protein [Sphingomonas sp. 67-41]OSZ68718.1 polysaccharide export protein [Sphingomonas sp. IBVSS2]
MRFIGFGRTILALGAAAALLAGCGGGGGRPELPPAAAVTQREVPSDEYVIGPMDQLQIFVWRNPELSAKVQVRPDGRITVPLISDMPAVGKTPAMLADDLKFALSEYIKDPIVSVIVENFNGTYSQQVRVVGATEKPASIPYRANMTLLDAMIAVGGLSEFAAGNRARLVRYDRQTGKQTEYKVRLGDLLKNGDIKANVKLEPGDVIIIPTSMF